MWKLALLSGGLVAQSIVSPLTPTPASTPLPVDDRLTVAVIDTGITAHPQLGWALGSNGVGSPVPPTLPGFDFVSDPWQAADRDGWDSDPSDRGDGVRPKESFRCLQRLSSWHGTSVIGTIRVNAPKAALLPIRVMGRCGGSTGDVAAAVNWAAGIDVPGVRRNPHPADIINLSFGGPSSVCPKALQAAISAAVERGSVIVVAAGSSSTVGQDTAALTPANCEGVFSVGSTDANGHRSPWSGFGREVDISGFGGDMSMNPEGGILSATNTGRYRPRDPSFGYYAGSSAAAALTSAALALLASADPVLRGPLLEGSLTAFVDPFAPGECDVGDGLCGLGTLDLDRVRAYVLTDNMQHS